MFRGRRPAGRVEQTMVNLLIALFLALCVLWGVEAVLFLLTYRSSVLAEDTRALGGPSENL
jgi:hypothetical protein